ncbi:dentin sialophosphoprotein-like [Octopus sinensis]|uniref:Dentin sialophosphoprotein-like n=1 Tax=Octopus sinensis TaxID=2607531 RepID=A0A7E6F1J5_9MOLL|nr:dentin sialophosphoprotein-like [Octopus sinensis]
MITTSKVILLSAFLLSVVTQLWCAPIPIISIGNKPHDDETDSSSSSEISENDKFSMGHPRVPATHMFNDLETKATIRNEVSYEPHRGQMFTPNVGSSHWTNDYKLGMRTMNKLFEEGERFDQKINYLIEKKNAYLNGKNSFKVFMIKDIGPDSNLVSDIDTHDRLDSKQNVKNITENGKILTERIFSLPFKSDITKSFENIGPGNVFHMSQSFDNGNKVLKGLLDEIKYGSILSKADPVGVEDPYRDTLLDTPIPKRIRTNTEHSSITKGHSDNFMDINVKDIGNLRESRGQSKFLIDDSDLSQGFGNDDDGEDSEDADSKASQSGAEASSEAGSKIVSDEATKEDENEDDDSEDDEDGGEEESKESKESLEREEETGKKAAESANESGEEESDEETEEEDDDDEDDLMQMKLGEPELGMGVVDEEGEDNNGSNSSDSDSEEDDDDDDDGNNGNGNGNNNCVNGNFEDGCNGNKNKDTGGYNGNKNEDTGGSDSDDDDDDEIGNGNVSDQDEDDNDNGAEKLIMADIKKHIEMGKDKRGTWFARKKTKPKAQKKKSVTIKVTHAKKGNKHRVSIKQKAPKTKSHSKRHNHKHGIHLNITTKMSKKDDPDDLGEKFTEYDKDAPDMMKSLFMTNITITNSSAGLRNTLGNDDSNESAESTKTDDSKPQSTKSPSPLASYKIVGEKPPLKITMNISKQKDTSAQGDGEGIEKEFNPSEIDSFIKQLKSVYDDDDDFIMFLMKLLKKELRSRLSKN